MLEIDGPTLEPEQSHNGERKGVEKDFSTQLQERLQNLAERSDRTSFEIGFSTHFEDDPEGQGFEVTLDQQPRKNSQNIRFSYGGVHGGLASIDGVIIDISPHTYNDPEAHLVDWYKIASNDEAPSAIREIATCMHEFIKNPGRVEPLNEEKFSIFTNAIWDMVNELQGPTLYSTFNLYNTHIGEVTVNAFGDMASTEGTYLPDDQKPGQYVSLHTTEFSYYREVRDGAATEVYSEPSDTKSLPPLTEEERKRHPYVVISAEQGMPHREEDEILIDENGKAGTMQYRTDGYTVISANISDAVTMTMQTWHKTKEEAQAWADNRYQHDLAHNSRDTSMNPERQKKVLDALDAALLVTELQLPEILES